MGRKNKVPLADRVARAAEQVLAADHVVTAVDILMGIGWLDFTTMERWRRGQVACLEEALHVDPMRGAEALAALRVWAAAKGLIASPTDYLARSPQRQSLRFSASGDAAIEAAYRTHWLSPELSEKTRERVAEKASRPPELVAVIPLNREWKCHRCGGAGDFLMMEDPGPACLRCVGLGDLEYLPAGDALVTRRAKAGSARHAVVVRFSRTRGRYERQGLLVEPQALAEAERSAGRRTETAAGRDHASAPVGRTRTA
ncbi:hypothetical protein DFR50_1663 [Roseiarcus fermentans]|uniref:DUF2293 domain-containing protein n=1 Tax=Roseiarcus fermentans TaxID=1473586 RepID=A0A366EEM1_9HYPH|nr:hypothetical protein [Roseiarcus fermentans]RBP00861.1 hypothetical protein DFR50_1663 [Roseiarcus fermentans]